MKPKTPFTIPNKKFNVIDLFRYAMKSKENLQLKYYMMNIEKFLKSIPASCISRENYLTMVKRIVKFIQ